jgi:hypothetical protein
MNKADEAALVSLHGKLAEVLKDALAGDYRDDNGNAAPPPAAILNVARQFLKDNKIEVGAAPKGSAIGDLSDLPVFDDAGDNHHMKYN